MIFLQQSVEKLQQAASVSIYWAVIFDFFIIQFRKHEYFTSRSQWAKMN